MTGDLSDISVHVPLRLNNSYHDAELSRRVREIIKPEFFHEWSEDSWKLDFAGLSSLEEAIHTDNCVGFTGPLGLRLRVGKYSFEVSTPFRLWQFLEDEVLRAHLLKAVTRVTTLLGGVEALVVPDNATRSSGFADWVMKPATIDEIKAGLLSVVGPPCKSTEELVARQEVDHDYDGYLFYDLRSGPVDH